MTLSAPALVCEGCGHVAQAPPAGPLLFRCPAAEGSPGDHVLAPPPPSAEVPWPQEQAANPFVAYRSLAWSYALARSLGLGDGDYVALVRRLDQAVAAVSGRGFHRTLLLRAERLDTACSAVWVKDETGHVAGSHKARHLFGVLLVLEVLRAAGLADDRAPLAIASCGNAALAAAVLARAAGRELSVFVPEEASGSVRARLRSLGAAVDVCARPEGTLGDPTLRAFRRAVAGGALPFACQGSECGLTLEGGKTLAYEVVDSGLSFERVFVQVGGGALGSAFVRGLDDAVVRGRLSRSPRVMAVQGEAVAPLAAGYARIVGEVVRSGAGTLPEGPSDALADALRTPPQSVRLRAVLARVAAQRVDYLPPWPTPRPSVAHGILDDETYDALALLGGLFRTGGSPVVAPEALLAEAQQLGRRATGIDVCATGAAGLAGLLAWPGPAARERALLLFTGTNR
jgi:threonine synthase